MRIFLVVLAVLFVAPVLGAPFVVCDPPPAGENVVGYELVFDGATAAERTLAPLRYDLAPFSPGRHDVRLRAVAEETYTGDDGSTVTLEVFSGYVDWGFVKTGRGEVKIPGNVGVAPK